MTFFWNISSQYQVRDLGLIQQIIDCAVEQVSSTKMVTDQFEGASCLFWSIRLLILYGRRGQLKIEGNPDLDDSIEPSLSQTYQQKILRFKSFGWILRFTESRDSRLRVMTWDLLTLMFNYEFLKAHPSMVHQSIGVFLRNNELFSVKISVLKFLNKVCESLMKNCEDPEDSESNRDLSEVDEHSHRNLQGQVEMMTV